MPILVLCTEENGLEIRTDNGTLFVFESIRTNPLIPLTSMTKDQCIDRLNHNQIDQTAKEQAIEVLESIVTEEGLAVGTPSVQVAELITSPDGAVEGRWADDRPPKKPGFFNLFSGFFNLFSGFFNLFSSSRSEVQRVTEAVPEAIAPEATAEPIAPEAVPEEVSRGVDATAGVKGLTGFVTVRFNPGQVPTMTLSAYTNEPTVNYHENNADTIANTHSKLATSPSESEVQEADKTIKKLYPELVNPVLDNKKFNSLLHNANLYIPHTGGFLTGDAQEVLQEVEAAINDIGECIDKIYNLDPPPHILALTDENITVNYSNRIAFIGQEQKRRLERLCNTQDLDSGLAQQLCDSLNTLLTVTSSFNLHQNDALWLTSCLSIVESRVGTSPSPP